MKRSKLEFPAWLKWITPHWTWDWAWQVYVEDKLRQVTEGGMRKLMLSLPPQHGKSSLVTERYPVYRLAQNPGLRVGIGSYNQDFANRFGRRTRRLAMQAGVQVSGDSRSVSDWETPQQGGVISVGVGSGITGRPIDLLVIDDPVKSRQEADSEAYRQRVWEWYTDDLYTRLQQDGAIILIMTRWHQDDLAGRILNSEDAANWVDINLPAECEVQPDPLGRAIGDPLCPERFDKAALADKRSVLGSYAYAALYQGRPAPREGGMFKLEWFEIVGAAPAVARRVRYWDMAGTRDAGDWTVGTLMSRTGQGLYYVENVVRCRVSSHGAEQRVLQTAQMDGPAVQIWMEQEPGSAGKSVIASYVRLLAGFSFHGEPATGSKELRAEPFAAQCEAGNVKLIRGAWNAAWLDEFAAFPNGLHDDQVDSASAGFTRLTERRVIRMPAVGGERTVVTGYKPR